MNCWPFPVLEVMSYRTISLLTTDVKTRRLLGISRQIMEEALKSLNASPKILVRQSNTMWDILLATSDEVKALAGGILTTKSVRLQTKYLGTWKTK